MTFEIQSPPLSLKTIGDIDIHHIVNINNSIFWAAHRMFSRKTNSEFTWIFDQLQEVVIKAIETGMILFKDRVAADFLVRSMEFHDIGLGYLWNTFQNFPTYSLLNWIRILKKKKVTKLRFNLEKPYLRQSLSHWHT